MNALVSIDVATLTPATVFAPGGVEAIIAKIEAEVSTEVFTLDTAEGRERIKSVAYKVARSKTALDDMGKELVAGIKAQAATVDADRRTIRDRLDALKERVRGPLTDWEDAEAARIDGHEKALVWLVECTRFATTPTVAMIRAQIVDAVQLTDRDWQEFKERGGALTKEAIANLDAMLQAAKQAERDAAELAELRKLKAERDERDRIEAEAKAKAGRAAQEAAQAAEKVLHEAEQKAARDAAEAARVAEWQRKREEQAELDVQAAVARALEADRRQQEQKAAADAAKKAAEEAAERKRRENKKHRAKVQQEIAAALTAHLFHDTPDEEGEELVLTIIGHITAGRIPHVSITY